MNIYLFLKHNRALKTNDLLAFTVLKIFGEESSAFAKVFLSIFKYASGLTFKSQFIDQFHRLDEIKYDELKKDVYFHKNIQGRIYLVF